MLNRRTAFKLAATALGATALPAVSACFLANSESSPTVKKVCWAQATRHYHNFIVVSGGILVSNGTFIPHNRIFDPNLELKRAKVGSNGACILTKYIGNRNYKAVALSVQIN